MNRRAFGNEGEDMACAYLKKHGWKIIDRNVQRGGCEIDIIALKRGVVSFVEVKRRSSEDFGRPAEAVNYTKRKHIVRAALLYAQEKRLRDANLRFDIIEVSAEGVNHIENAFDATGLGV